MQFGDNLLSTVASDWTLTNATMDSLGVLTLAAGGSAGITYTELSGTNLLPEAIKIAVTAVSYPARYTANAYIRLKIVYTDNNTFIATLPITNIGSGFSAILRPTVSNYDIDVSSYVSIEYYIYSSVALVLDTYTFQKSLGDSLIEDTLYYGIKISTEEGLVITRSDGAMKAVFNAGQFTMQVYDSATSSWIDKIYFDPTAGTYIFDGELSADVINVLSTLITPNLYAGKATIAELTVDQLDTSDKVQLYLDADTSNDDFQRIYDQFHEFITAELSSTTPIQCTNRNGEPLYWVDETHESSGTEVTDYPVYSYQYTEYTKMKIGFQTEAQSLNNIPMIELGVGTGTDNYGKGYIYKGTDGLYLDYYSGTTGELRRILLTDDGLVFTPYELESIDFYANGFTVGYSGQSFAYTWTLNADGSIATLVTEDNVTIPITWHTGDM